MHGYPFALQRLINEVSKLPGVGPRMAERIAFYMLKKESDYMDNFASILEAVKKITFCPLCFNVSEGGQCSICADDSRDASVLCVVESPEDIITVERTGKFKGYYHVLNGLISPVDGIMPEKLKLGELNARVKKTGGLKEVILAVNHTVEGDATVLYAVSLIKENGSFKITRLAKGLPTGSDIRYADELTLGQAITERKEI
ncbi:MAG TPA: recombination protein RecR [bacterium]|nr:recombination protein RecR [bacterium]